jgi:hypothetical protein
LLTLSGLSSLFNKIGRILQQIGDALLLSLGVVTVDMLLHAIWLQNAGEAIPSIVVLWVMRDMPPRSRDPSLHGCPVPVDSIENGLEQALIPDTGHMPQWIVSPSGRQYLVVPVQPSNDITRQKSEVQIPRRL